jgi:AAA ATPase domain/Adenylate and Guanylate cyclase catalytic domain
MECCDRCRVAHEVSHLGYWASLVNERRGVGVAKCFHVQGTELSPPGCRVEPGPKRGLFPSRFPVRRRKHPTLGLNRPGFSGGTCYAALHLRDELRRYADDLRRKATLNFSVRMGMNSGEVVVGKIGDDLRMDYTAQGHTVGPAAPMEQLAEPGRVYLTEETAKLVSGFFRLRDLGPFELKGASAAVQVYELEGVGALRTSIEVSRSRGFSRFVGRTDEMATLEAALGRAIEGSGQVIGVVAHPGPGKSRLCFEFAEHCRARGITVYEAHGFPHGKLAPFLPILDLLRVVFRITEQDSSEAARDKIAGRMLLLDEGLKDALPLMFDFLGVSDPDRPAPQMEPEVRLRQLFGVVKRVSQARSRREPAVISSKTSIGSTEAAMGFWRFSSTRQKGCARSSS